ncbi:hypothetical protein Kpho02_31650 [Kitasatospora phosalacinea]|uniref:Uncharacterized protein n=1 Tax=Kitasatospora phosalacinea TaxID=2065 RepID=A0A9W6Q9D5_9ACTN|nr:hypothetical protein [Kitasatospora phosalacinea]GLW70866.1 hypothetical protein Kpho02_31650 [Kitasatospora phosalacinea]
MSCGPHLPRFADGAAAEPDAARIPEPTAPHLPRTGREDAYAELVLPDGGTVGLHRPAAPGTGLRRTTAHRLQRGDPTERALRAVLARI